MLVLLADPTPQPIPQPMISDWMQGIGTVVGAVFSALAFVIALRLYFHEVSKRREGKHEAALARARLITLEVHPKGKDDEEHVTQALILVKNNGQETVSDPSLSLNPWTKVAG